MHHHVAEKWGVGANKGSSLKTDQPEVQLTSAWVGMDCSKSQTAGDFKLHLNEAKQLLVAVGVGEKQGKTNLKGIFHDKAEFTHFAGLT